MSAYSSHHSAHPSAARTSVPNWKWWIPGTGIDRSVITSEIQRYLGSDALVRPGPGKGENQGLDGYWISAYRNLTTAMIEDLKRESIRYRKEKEQQQAPAARYQEQPHHDPRTSVLGPTPPPLAAHSSSVYPPPTTRSPYTPDTVYPPPTRGGQPQQQQQQQQQQPAGYPQQTYGTGVESQHPDYHYQTQQLAYAGQQSNVSPNAPYAHPHYTAGAPAGQQPAGGYPGYPSPPATQYPQHAYPNQPSVPRQAQYQNPAAGYSQAQQPYGYQTPTTSSNAYPGGYQTSSQYPGYR